jgi:hypothetical protein
MNCGSCDVDVEQWTALKGAASGYLSYYRDRNLRRFKWSTGAVIYHNDRKWNGYNV